MWHGCVSRISPISNGKKSAILGLLAAFTLSTFYAYNYYYTSLQKVATITEKPNIIFLETSGRTSLRARVGCALESAALHHPERIVVLYSTGTIDSNDSYRNALKNVSNVQFEHLDLGRIFNYTPLSSWHQSKAFNGSQFKVAHLSDAVRLAILWKQGGTYLDTDMITVRPLGSVSNALGYGGGNAGNSALTFDKGHLFLYVCMQDYVSKYNPNVYASNGPSLVTRVLKNLCSVQDLKEAINEPGKCHGVTLLPDHSFYSFAWNQWKKLFGNWQEVDISHSYTVHLYSKMTSKTNGKPGDGSLIDYLTTNNCPNIYQLMVQNNTL